MTPPTIGPVGVDFDGAAWPGNEPILTQVVDAQASQEGALNEHVSSEAHGGHDGGSGGH
jgi:hypothetical protein